MLAQTEITDLLYSQRPHFYRYLTDVDRRPHFNRRNHLYTPGIFLLREAHITQEIVWTMGAALCSEPRISTPR